jgi:competence protein ComEC
MRLLMKNKWRIILTLFIASLLLSNGTIVKSEAEKQLKVHFIDVGDADSILIEQENKYMLIDGGNDKDSEIIREYLSKLGVTKIDILIGTHVEEDHIGSLDSVINDFNIGKIYLPCSNTTNKYIEDILKAVNRKNIQITEPACGETFELGDAICTILAPVSKGYEKLNNYSIVIKLQYGETSFLFTGDAERISEKEMMRRGFDLSANVLKVSHHGSISSTSTEFLNRVCPQYAVITAGRGNNYRHPHKSTLRKLKDMGIKVYRTDESGTIVAVSDGKNISFNKKPGSYLYRGK